MTEPVTYPFSEPERLEVDPNYGVTQNGEGLTRVQLPYGTPAYIATRYEDVKSVLSDPRFSRELAVGEDEPRVMPYVHRPDALTTMDPPRHSRLRRVVSKAFSARRIEALRPSTQQIVDTLLDRMQADGGPVDLMRSYALEVPMLVVCELLGVPYEDTPRFQRYALDMVRLDLEPERFAAAFAAMSGYLRELIAAKRAEPTDDLLSGLLTTDLDDDELTNIGFVLFGAGLDTTANMLALGVFALLEHPEQLAALRADPGLAEGTVEELLRYLSIIPFTLRTALEDLELGGELIKAGQTITISIPAADRDPARFADPDTLDLTRPANSHVAFGHGVHQCLGQQLARVELQVALPALFARFPTLRLAVPPEEVPLRADMLIYGVHGLPVTWD